MSLSPENKVFYFKQLDKWLKEYCEEDLVMYARHGNEKWKFYGFYSYSRPTFWNTASTLLVSFAELDDKICIFSTESAKYKIEVVDKSLSRKIALFREILKLHFPQDRWGNTATLTDKLKLQTNCYKLGFDFANEKAF